jgi:hypothetical protein
MFVSTLGCFGCATGDVALEDAIPVESPELDAPTLDLGRFHVPEAMRTAFLRTSPGLLTLDASEGRFLLELGEEPLRFADDAALRAHLVELGATPGAASPIRSRPRSAASTASPSSAIARSASTPTASATASRATSSPR